MSFSEISILNQPASFVTTDNMSLLTEGATSIVSDQMMNVNVLQDGALTGLDNTKQYILAQSADGTTVLIEASQLAMFTDQPAPLFDASSLFQVASQPNAETVNEPKKDVVDTSAADVQQNFTVEDAEKENYCDEEILLPDKKGYKCTFCNMDFYSFKQLHRHTKTHAEDKPHRCTECTASFNRQHNLHLHIATHSTNEQLQCPACRRNFTRLASLKSHLLLHEAEENLVCSECGDEFSTEYKLSKHMEEHMRECIVDQNFNCPSCPKKFTKLNFLKEHLKIHHKLKASLSRRHYKKNIDRTAFPHKCYVCGKQFQKPSQLIRHNRIHTGERPYKCSQCDKAFNQKGALQVHEVKHSGERPYKCDFCNVGFVQKGNLRNHIQRVHSLAESSETCFKCELCSCSFRKLGSMNAHMSRYHHGEIASMQLQNTEEVRKPGEDNIDVEKLAADSADILQQALENSGLASEKRSHQSSKPFQVTSVTDAETGSIRKHIIQQVDGVRYFQCIYCSKNFKKPSDLVRHIRIHNHEKPYKCTQCYRAFAVKSTLKSHLRTHSGAKDFTCDICNKAFSTGGSLKVHSLLHTGAKPHPCTFDTCDKTFRTRSHRNNHLATHRKVKKPKKPRKSQAKGSLDLNMSNIPLQEPIMITNEGWVQPVPRNSVMYNQLVRARFPSSERPFQCQSCDKAFKKSSHLKQHSMSHTGEKPFVCHQCDRSFVSNGVLKSHIKTHSGMKSFACNVCSATFTTKGSLHRHMCTHSNERPFMCPYCQKTFKTSMNCRKHTYTHRYEVAQEGYSVALSAPHDSSVEMREEETAGEMSVVENSGITASSVYPGFSQEDEPKELEMDHLRSMTHLSSEVFETDAGLDEHVMTIPDSHPTRQDENGIFTMSDIDYQQNAITLVREAENEEQVAASNLLSSSTDQRQEEYDIVPSQQLPEKKQKKVRFKKPFQCQQCQKVFKTSSHMKQHMTLHTGDRPFRCQTCGDMFTRLRILKNHIQMRHENLIEHICPTCNLSFVSFSSLQRHMNTHDSGTRCAYCNERFPTKDLYKVHLKEYHPDVTNKDMSSARDQVQQPIAKSSGITLIDKDNNSIELKPHQINTEVPTGAEQSTSTNSTSGRQKSKKGRSRGQSAHVCHYCSKYFRKPSDLVRHMRTHTGERPYKCERCSKCFSVKSTLDAHTLTHTGKKNFECHVCSSLFATRGSLKVHMRLHTGVKPFKCPHCDQAFRTSGHRKSHLTSHFKIKSSARKQKKTISAMVNKETFQQAENQTITLGEDFLNILQQQVASSGVQLQPQTIQQNIQFATSDSAMLTKPIQIDPSVWQQLSQQLNLNLTLNNPTVAVDGGTTYNIQQPNMIVQYTIPPQQVENSDNVTLLISDPNLAGNGNEVLSNGTLFDGQVVTISGNNVQFVNQSEEIFSSQDEGGGFTELDPVLIEKVDYNFFTCSTCSKCFKTPSELNKHMKSHRKPNSYYQCDECSQQFAKKNQLIKHLTTEHKSS